jgi:hypothetical protein
MSSEKWVTFLGFLTGFFMVVIVGNYIIDSQSRSIRQSYSIGIGLVLLSSNSRVAIIGWTTIFSVGLFAATILVFELKIHKLMKSNQRELAGSLVA